MVEVAKKYLEYGWSIFPVIISNKANGGFSKKPGVKWKQYQHRKPTVEEIEEWFKGDDFNGLGLVTGRISGVIVVDTEVEATEEDLKGIESTMVTKTISGGHHFFYKWEKEIGNTVRVKDSPIDFRGDGGFVVIPPSGKGNFTYEWVKKSNKLPSLPKWLEKKITEPKNNLVSKTSDGKYPVAKEGERNTMAASIAGDICLSMARKHWEPYGWHRLKDWNEANKPPLPVTELRNVWRSIKRSDKSSRPIETDVGIDLIPGNQVMDRYYKKKEAYGKGKRTGIPSLDSFFRFLPEHLYLVSAKTHVGKTSFVLNISAKMAKQGNNVLFLSLEQGLYIAPRVKSILDDDYPAKLAMMESEGMLEVRQMMKTIKQVKDLELVVIDHLNFLSTKGNTQYEVLDRSIHELQVFSKKASVPVLVVAHMRKFDDNRVPVLDDLKSSSALSQVPSVVMLLHREVDKSTEAGYLKSDGKLFVAKNRVTGKTGVLDFTLETSGRLDFGDEDKTFEDVKMAFKQDG